MKQVVEVTVVSPAGLEFVGTPSMTPFERAVVGYLLGIDPTLTRIEQVEKVIDFAEAAAKLRRGHDANSAAYKTTAE
jgi:hypothetical protein